MLLGIDTGGTFTDFVFYDGHTTRIHKALSTPSSPASAILQGIREMQLSREGLRIIHGSTVATNAVLEGKGARVVYISNRGLKDVLTIGRQARRELYNLQPAPVAPPVPPEYCLETGGRLAHDGEVIEPLTDSDIEQLLEQVHALQPQAVAVNLLYSFLDHSFERKIAEALPDDLFVSCSSEVLTEQKEYERGITTWLNAYVGPLMQGYLDHLAAELAPAKLAVMRSSGQTCEAGQAGREAVHLLLSGPAGGLSGIRYIGRLCGEPRLLTFDMGGTSTDVALVEEDIALTSQGSIGGYPVAVPMVDMHTIGAGGGSIARVDAGGALLVGPASAGAEPGPACYGQGGTRPTITDANLVLGRLPPFTRLGGRMELDCEAARQSLAGLVEPLGMASVEEVAEGIIRVANENMAQALRLISVQRGIDPRGFVLGAFGGAGGLHMCALAADLGIRKAIAPIHAGVLSALGMLVAPPGRQLSKTLGILVSECSHTIVSSVLDELAEKARTSMAAEGIDTRDLEYVPSVDLCYRGQAFALNVSWDGLAGSEAAFHEQHEALYGHRLDSPVELVNVRLGVAGKTLEPALADFAATATGGEPEYSAVYGVDNPVPVWQRQQLGSEQLLTGPAIIMDAIATVYVENHWQCRLDRAGNLLLEYGV